MIVAEWAIEAMDNQNHAHSYILFVITCIACDRKLGI